MKNFILFVLSLTVVSFAGVSCKDAYRDLTRIVSDQTTTTCKVSNDKNRNLWGFFFMIKGDKPNVLEPNVLVYNDNNEFVGIYDASDEKTKRHVHCLYGYVSNQEYMTSKQIITKLLSTKKCEEGFSFHLGKSFAPNKGTLTDSRDGQKYKTVQIGQQIWMAENLNYKAKGSVCPNNSSSNCTKYGRLYDWDMAKRSCPSGWHLPNTDEIQTLVKLLGGKSMAREILKKADICDDYDCGTDDFGFSVLPAGFFYAFGDEFLHVNNRPFFWTAKEDRGDFRYADYWDLGDGVQNFYGADKDDKYSVRCLRNELSEKSNIHEDDSDNEKEKIVVSSQKGMMVDPRDNQKYKTVTIGTQTWMAENLNYKTQDSYCYENEALNCSKYGRFYTWYAAIKACPSGWHLPSEAEFETLLTTVGGQSIAGKALKSRSGWYDNGNGSDAFGFSALPAGFRYGSGYGYSAYFWSATEHISSYAYNVYLVNDKEIASLNGDLKNSAFSVRCLKD